ncbi:hypothetical protein KR222_004934 [Zaprionus bogoriensis]|nr:hypothetical protein KR222_004934 [Zaprionus bogoriensis]
MAPRDAQTAIVIDSLIADLVQEAIVQRPSVEESKKSGPCQRIFDILGIAPCPMSDDELDITGSQSTVQNTKISGPTNGGPVKELRQQWHSWLAHALTNDSSEDELVLYRRKGLLDPKICSDCSVQTDQPRFRKRFPSVFATGDCALCGPAPCELNRQTIFIDAVPVATPSLQSRPPLADRFCYMLTDFASALYCSLAIMCCCTPSMFR